MVGPGYSNRAIFWSRVHSAMLNERHIDPCGPRKSWLTEGVIAPLTLVSTMCWLPLVVGFNACDVYDALATDSYVKGVEIGLPICVSCHGSCPLLVMEQQMVVRSQIGNSKGH